MWQAKEEKILNYLKMTFFVLPVGFCLQMLYVISVNKYFSVVEETKLLFFNGELYVKIVHTLYLPMKVLREVLQIVN